ncbi:gastrula zinc finger protein XlCGF17.1-like [Ostrinia furnacalis]|uniref:gastrula zinc finger protein XlCGF17.1-like n=1 Tax=Ostrinia furnacalis TaxID=93504 RepID=UPI00103AA642|nr:gastrula zinc finger protein XlCGF17.1-like [Ostrinia furnacalis]
MVGPLLLMKILHCKKRCKGSSRSNEEVSQRHSSTSRGEADDSLTFCRVCLKEGDIPIFAKKDISEALATFGGIEIDEDDRHPKHLCGPCHALLRGAILFRKTAQESDQILKKQEDNDDFLKGMDMDEDSLDCHIPVERRSEYHCKRCSEYHCKRCNIGFDTLSEYSEHRTSDEHENRRQVCPICHKSYASLYYKKHMMLHKLESPTHICDICGKTFTIRGQFTRHRLTHFYELPFKCSLCPYRGRFSESLKMHMRSHTGEKPYQCSQCAACFVSKSNLNKHTRTHRGPQDFKCEMCGRGFYTKRNLEMHLRVDHTGIKDHICNICGKAFGYRKQMMKHQLKVHKRQKLRSGRLPLYLQVENMGDNDESET